MSFILDALKKAESERSRQAGPVLMDVRIAPPRRRLPAWAWVLGAVLLVNLVLLTWLALRGPRAAGTDAADDAPAAATVAAQVAAPAVAMPATTAAATQPANTGATSALGAPLAPAPVVPAPSPAMNTAIGVPAAAPAAGDIEPDSLPTAQDLVAAGITLPALQLNLHVFDPAPANRYVLLNAVRLREGEYTPDGMKVERITARGVVLDAGGRRFLLPAGG